MFVEDSSISFRWAVAEGAVLNRPVGHDRCLFRFLYMALQALVDGY